MCLTSKASYPIAQSHRGFPARSAPQGAYGTLILALIKNSVPHTLYLVFLKYISFSINFRGKVTRLANLSCNKIQNIYFKLYQALPLNSLYHAKFLDDTSQFLLK